MATVIEVNEAALEELASRLKAAGINGIREILTAYNEGEIDDETRDLLLEDVVDDLGDAAKRFADRVVVLPEPAESLSDMAIDALVEVAEPQIITGVRWIGRGVHELFDRDAERLLRRIRRKRIRIAEAKNTRQRRRREKDLERLQRLLVVHFPDEATRQGIRLDRDGKLVVLEDDDE